MMNRVIYTVILFNILSVEILFAQLRIKAVGDIMLGSVTPKNILPVNDGKFFSDSIGIYLKCADIVFGNLEGSFITNGIQPEKCSEESRAKGICYEFGMPASLAPSLKQMGFTVLSLDNNHSEDYGKEGYEFTNHLLYEMEILSAGKRSYAELTINNKRIAVATFGYSSNSFNISDLDTAAPIVRELKKNYDLVIVSFHGGAEGSNFQHVPGEMEIFLGEKRGNVSAFAKTVIDAGADLVFGHGPHVLRGIELYKNKLIAYSLGNFLTYGNVNIKGANGRTMILEVVVDDVTGNFIRGKIIPVVQIGNGYPVYDNSFTAVHDIRRLNKLDFPKSPLTILDGGYFFSDLNLDAEPLPLIKPGKLKIPFDKILPLKVPQQLQIDLK